MSDEKLLYNVFLRVVDEAGVQNHHHLMDIEEVRKIQKQLNQGKDLDFCPIPIVKSEDEWFWIAHNTVKSARIVVKAAEKEEEKSDG